jgi:replication factor C subunit 2/4
MKRNEIPWIEKYRPRKLSDVISQDESINILNNTLKTGERPHLLLYGNPGTGKTSSILSLCNQLFGERVNERVLELNASDERGINIVRHKIINFAKLSIGTVDKKVLCPPYKIIILDEADAMTKEAQAALRKIMEDTSNITRFCFICNYINQIIEPINSRCVKIRFKPISIEYVIKKLNWISKKERMNINEDVISGIADIANGDLRKGILILQNTKYINIESEKSLVKDDIYKMCNYISDTEISYYLNKIIDGNSIIDVIDVAKDIINRGYVFNSVLIKIINFLIINEKISDEKKGNILFLIGIIEKNINDGANYYIQLLKLLNNLIVSS